MIKTSPSPVDAVPPCLYEAAPQDVDERFTARVEDAHGRHGRSLPWARVGVTALLNAADAAGWILTGRWTTDGRPFVELHRPNAGFDAARPLPGEGTDRR